MEYVYTIGMTETEIQRRLRDERIGVLSLANGNDAYALPLGFHYEDGSLLFRLGDTVESQKMAYVDTTNEACFLLYGVSSPENSWSIVASGQLDEVDAPEIASIRRRFGPLRVFDEVVEDMALRFFELDIETIAGRRTTA